MSVKRVGVIGGGQLARMMAKPAGALGLSLVVQTPSEGDPAVAVADDAVFAPVDDVAATRELAQRCDVITFENEFIDLEGSRPLAREGVCFRPGLDALARLLDKYHQRRYLEEIGAPVPRYFALEPGEEIAPSWGFPAVLKARRHGYDGQGTFILEDRDALQATWERLERPDLLLEAFVPFERELATIAARGATGEIVVYPVVETVQENQVCRYVLAPASVPEAAREKVEAIACSLLENLQVVGVFGIEFFLTREGEVLVNEIAPRTHNSGHYTIDACDVSQFETQLRAVAGLPMKSPRMTCGRAVMVNLLGHERANGDYTRQRQRLAEIPGAIVHWYGKTESRPGRKLGHVTVCLDAAGDEEARAIADRVSAVWQ